MHAAGGIGGLLAVLDWTLVTPQMSGLGQAYLYDGNGNVGQLLSLDDGSVVTAYECDPCGNITAETDGEYAPENPFRFSTKFHDDETGWVYYGYRFYGPQWGRWGSRDPMAMTVSRVPGGDSDMGQIPIARDQYSILEFEQSNPVCAIDPLGLKIAPIGCCGPDITRPLFQLMSEFRRKFLSLPPSQQGNICTSFISPSGWDIVQLYLAGQLHGWAGFQSQGCGTRDCAGTVEVFGKCYRSAEVNYLLFGHAKRMCFQRAPSIFSSVRISSDTYYFSASGGFERSDAFENKCSDIYYWRLGAPIIDWVSGVKPNKIGQGSTACRCAWFHIGWEGTGFEKASDCVMGGCSSCGKAYTGQLQGHVGFLWS